jgi:hypothetical protein
MGNLDLIPKDLLPYIFILFQVVKYTLTLQANQHTFFVVRSRDSSVGIATGYWLDDRGVGVRVLLGSRIFTSPRRLDRLWGSPNLLSNGYRRLFPGGKAARA